MEDDDNGRYMGVKIQKNYNIFKQQWELAKQKARRGATLLSILMRRCHIPPNDFETPVVIVYPTGLSIWNRNYGL